MLRVASLFRQSCVPRLAPTAVRLSPPAAAPGRLHLSSTATLKPVGVDKARFEDIRAGDFVYVDKTAQLFALAEKRGNNKFLSRPRKFGKTLALTTLAAMFDTNVERKCALFDGTWLAQHQAEWLAAPEQQATVLHFDFGKVDHLDLKVDLLAAVQKFARKHSISLYSKGSLQSILAELVDAVPNPVVLVDEYDKPIVNVLEANGGRANKLAQDNLEIMRGFFDTLKGSSLRFSFVTGVSKFALSGLFSGTNHYDDISLDQPYSSICGYTKQEVRDNFAEHAELVRVENGMASVEEVLERAFKQYNGYSWTDTRDEATVCNPFSIGMLFYKLKFGKWWIRQGASGWLPRVLKASPAFDTTVFCEATMMPKFELKPDGQHAVDSANLMLQTGYLTVKEYDIHKGMRLDFPNEEVRQGFDEIVSDLIGMPVATANIILRELQDALAENDFLKVVALCEESLRAVPHQSLRHSQENVYREHLRMMLSFVPNVRVEAEMSDTSGDADLIVHTQAALHVIEVKLVGADATAAAIASALARGMAQAKARFVGRNLESKRVHRAAIVVRQRRSSDAQQQDALAGDALAHNLIVAAQIGDSTHEDFVRVMCNHFAQ